MVYTKKIDTPIGCLTLFEAQGCLVAVAFEDEDLINKTAYVQKHFEQEIKEKSTPLLNQAQDEIEEYFAGKRKSFDVKVKLCVTEFQNKVINAVNNIPYGSTKSYFDISDDIGIPNSYRAVGNANKNNPLPIIFPCHRVNARSGMTSGYQAGIGVKRKLLELEERYCLIEQSEIISQNELLNPTLTAYIRESVKVDEDLRLKEYADKNNIPISKPETLSVLSLLLKIHKPKNILEIGTAVGYSAKFMASCCNGAITTVERDPKMIAVAEETLKGTKIKLVQADGMDYLKETNEKFDFIYIDAAKGQYINYYPHIKRLLARGGVAVFDNVLYKGITANLGVVKHKNRTMVKNLIEFNKMALSDKDFVSTIIPVGDGLLITVKGESDE